MKRWTVVLAVLLVLASCGERKPETVTATTADGNRRVVCYGPLEGQKTSEIVLKKGAVLSRAYVEKGDCVSKGDRLMDVTVDGRETSYCADCDGIVSELADQNSVSDGKKAACSLLNAGTLRIVIRLGEDVVRDVQVGDPARVEGTAFGERAYSAVIEKVAAVPEVSDAGTYYRAVVGLLEQDETLLPGMTAKVTLEITLRDCVLLPYSAVAFDDKGYYACSPEGDRLGLTQAVYCREGYAVSGLPSGETVARFADGEDG